MKAHLVSTAVEILFGVSEALVSAKTLIGREDVEVDEALDSVTYVHLLLAEHEILDAEGVPAESLFLGEEALGRMGSDTLQELAAIFPSDASDRGEGFGRAARMILSGREAMLLASIEMDR